MIVRSFISVKWQEKKLSMIKIFNFLFLIIFDCFYAMIKTFILTKYNNAGLSFLDNERVLPQLIYFYRVKRSITFFISGN